MFGLSSEAFLNRATTARDLNGPSSAPALVDGDFRALFEALPGSYLVLTPEFLIVAASYAYLLATATARDAMVGRSIFEVFPKNPSDPAASATQDGLRSSLERARTSLHGDAMPIQKYDIPRRDEDGGGFVERFWSPYNAPVLDPAGNLRFFISRLEDVTEFVQFKQHRAENGRPSTELRSRTVGTEAELFVRTEQVTRSQEQLQRAHQQLERASKTLARNTRRLKVSPEALEREKAQALLLGYERSERVAMRFQEAALPQRLPQIAGLSFDGFYRAASDEALVGGDWYDVISLADGLVAISVGDVGGTGLKAAVTMAGTRQVIRGVAFVHPDPVVILDAARKSLLAEHPDTYVSAFVGIIDLRAMTLIYASAGHPPPLLRRQDGSVEELSDPGGLLLGLPATGVRAPEKIRLSEGSLLVLYTDGLVEATHNVIDGQAKLSAILSDPACAAHEHPALCIFEHMLGKAAQDDVAVLTILMAPPHGGGGTRAAA